MNVVLQSLLDNLKSDETKRSAQLTSELDTLDCVNQIFSPATDSITDLHAMFTDAYKLSPGEDDGSPSITINLMACKVCFEWRLVQSDEDITKAIAKLNGDGEEPAMPLGCGLIINAPLSTSGGRPGPQPTRAHSAQRPLRPRALPPPSAGFQHRGELRLQIHMPAWPLKSGRRLACDLDSENEPAIYPNTAMPVQGKTNKQQGPGLCASPGLRPPTHPPWEGKAYSHFSWTTHPPP